MPIQAMPLLLTKLHIPLDRAAWLQRQRLFDRLDAMLHTQIGLIAAPAGYGKTALLARWARAHQAASASADQAIAWAFAWVSLDEGDNDPVRFWSYLIAALQNCAPARSLGQDFFDLLRSPGAPPLQTLLVLLINEIAQIPLEMVLVLDDTQALTSLELIEQLRFFLEHLPANLHLILSGRSEPPLPLARYRARGQLIQLGPAELRFTHAETVAFFQECTHLDLAAPEINALDRRAEGWVAGLHLASLSMEGVEDKQAFIQSFAGSDRYLLDYLTEEILAHQPQPVQDFLLRTAILGRLCPALCEAVLLPQAGATESAAPVDCQKMLDDLDRANLFLYPLDSAASPIGTHTWYRYHRLFADLLQTRLKQSAPVLVPELHRRAAHWFAEQGYPLEAFNHAAAAGDQDLAANLVRHHQQDFIARAETATLAAWLATFPQEVLLNRAELCLAKAWVNLYHLRFDEVEIWAKRAGSLIQASPGPNIESNLGQVEALRATVAINLKEFDQGIQLANQALQHLAAQPELDLIRSLIYLNLGDAYSERNQFPAAIQACQSALDAARPFDNHTLDVIIIGSLGSQFFHQGHLYQAERVLQQALQVEQDFLAGGGGTLLALGKPLASLCRIYIEWNRLDLAQELAARALNYCQRWQHPTHLLDACLVQAEVRALLGDDSGCQAALTLAWQHIDHLRSHPTYQAMHQVYPVHIRRCEARIALRAGDWQRAERLLRQDPDAGEASPGLKHQKNSLQADLWLQSARPGEALALAIQLAETARQNTWLHAEAQGLLFQALAHQQLGDLNSARRIFKQALILAEPEGYVRLFLDGGESARQLLEAQRSRTGTEMAYIDQLLSALGSPIEPPLKTEPTRPPGTLFSDRERQILRLLAAGLTNDEIAAELILSTNTVKTHLKRIFEKLGAANRMEAANLAREQGWI